MVSPNKGFRFLHPCYFHQRDGKSGTQKYNHFQPLHLHLFLTTFLVLCTSYLAFLAFWVNVFGFTRDSSMGWRIEHPEVISIALIRIHYIEAHLLS